MQLLPTIEGVRNLMDALAVLRCVCVSVCFEANGGPKQAVATN